MLNATQKTMLLETATAFSSANASGFKAITKGAIYVVVSEKAGIKSGEIKEALIKALMGADLKNSTANNYVSRCLTVARFFRWELDPAKTFAANADDVFPQVVALWGEINLIKRTGPSSERAAAEPAARAKAPRLTLSNSAPAQVAEVFRQRIADFDTQTLVDIQAMIVADLAKREMTARHIEAMPLAA